MRAAPGWHRIVAALCSSQPSRTVAPPGRATCRPKRSAAERPFASRALERKRRHEGDARVPDSTSSAAPPECRYGCSLVACNRLSAAARAASPHPRRSGASHRCFAREQLPRCFDLPVGGEARCVRPVVARACRVPALPIDRIERPGGVTAVLLHAEIHRHRAARTAHHPAVLASVRCSAKTPALRASVCARASPRIAVARQHRQSRRRSDHHGEDTG